MKVWEVRPWWVVMIAGIGAFAGGYFMALGGLL